MTDEMKDVMDLMYTIQYNMEIGRVVTEDDVFSWCFMMPSDRLRDKGHVTRMADSLHKVACSLMLAHATAVLRKGDVK